ncbi:hypothetical protein NDU88_007097 [Pleurodeles waltl]|uniref:Uncharacterized protein n=1 Tax=Pleurodeles waltl TaxID=8319 RepID=A0AAV7U212_PLEWA|nr:hypothetical protein NDU88_007097 [Pleurodeles waltl]
MERDQKVREALALLRQAGRMDLVKEEALAPGRPVCNASAGVAVAVAACSPPRAAGRAQVRGFSRGAVRRAGLAVAGAVKGRAGRRGPGQGAPRVSLWVERPRGLRSSWNSALRTSSGACGAARRRGHRKGAAEVIPGGRAGRVVELWAVSLLELLSIQNTEYGLNMA